MQPLTFPCPSCGRRMGVGLELAGRSVRCPHCRQVVTAPTAAAPAAPPRPPTPGRPAPAPQPEGAESIFGEAADEDDILGAPPPPRKPVMPPAPAPVPPLPPPKPAARPGAGFPTPQPVPPTAEDANPFAALDAAAPAEPPSDRRRRKEEPPRPRAPRSGGMPAWPWVVTGLLAFYGVVMTALAAWGWLRR